MTDLGTADGPMPTHSNTIRGDAGTIPLSFTLPGRAPVRIQMSRQHPWRAANPSAIIVSRPSRWGNPFGIGVRVPLHWSSEPKGPISVGNIEAENRAEAVAYFRDWMNGIVELDVLRPLTAPLAGHDLACWCPLDQPCHADVLLEIANKEADAA